MKKNNATQLDTNKENLRNILSRMCKKYFVEFRIKKRRGMFRHILRHNSFIAKILEGLINEQKKKKERPKKTCIKEYKKTS